MKDALLDIVKHTHNLGVIDLVKVTGSQEKTQLSAIGADKTVVLEAAFHNPVAEFIGQFGMPNLSKLNTILSIPEYQEDAKLTINKKTENGQELPAGIHFENKVGDFKNDYRFMTATMVNDLIPEITFKNVKWGVEFEPSVASIQRLRYQTQANNDETTFVAKTDGTNLKFFFGDASSHAGDFVFAANITGTLTKSWNWPIAVVNSILALPGDKIMRFSDEGASQIIVDSGIATYNYILPAQKK